MTRSGDKDHVFHSKFKIRPIDNSLQQKNPFNSGERVGCYAILGGNGQIELVPPNRDVAFFWKCMMDKKDHHMHRNRDIVSEPFPNQPINGVTSDQQSEAEWNSSPSSFESQCQRIEPKAIHQTRRSSEPIPVIHSNVRGTKPTPIPPIKDSQIGGGGEDMLTASDLAALCGITEGEALETIRAINDRGEDHLDQVGFEVLKEYIKARDRRKSIHCNLSQSSSRMASVDNAVKPTGGEAVILQGRGKLYSVDVILGNANVRIGNTQLAYDQITSVHSSNNCCLAIMTKRGKILLQCSSNAIRDHWKQLLEARS